VPTEYEDRTLRHFCMICDELQACRFTRRMFEGPHTFHASIDPDQCSVPHYDRDDFRSFATLFRKLDADGEPTNIFKVMNILKRYVPREDHARFNDVKKLLITEAERPMTVMAIGPAGAEETFTPKRIRNVIFNGQIFHTDPTMQEGVAKLMDFEPFAIVSFICYAVPLVSAATKYAEAIRKVNFFRPIAAE
jgi:hypothetical protein